MSKICNQCDQPVDDCECTDCCPNCELDWDDCVCVECDKCGEAIDNCERV